MGIFDDIRAKMETRAQVRTDREELEIANAERYADISGELGASPIWRPAGGPVGGYVRPADRITPHTGYEMDGDGIKTPTGGGVNLGSVIPDDPRELIRARPDLQGIQAPPQLAVGAPITAPQISRGQQALARASALRAGA